VRSTLPLLAAVIAVTSGVACGKGEDVALAPLTVTPDAQAPPHDHLGDGELLEGTARVFGLVLPRGVSIDSNLPPQVIASGDPRAGDVANYVRTRVAMGTVKVGAASTMFNQVQVPANPGRELSIRVEPRENGTGVRMTIRDVTPPPVDQTLTEDQRWRKVGIAPGGKIADPAHLH